MVFVIFNDSILEFSEFFHTMLNLINLYSSLMKYSYNEKIKQNLLISPNYFAYHFVIFTCLFTISFIILASLAYMFREASAIEIINEDNELMQRLNGLSERLEKLAIKKRDNSLNITSDIKQIIWLCLSGSSDLYNEKLYSNSRNNGGIEENKFMIFNKSPQIVSFFKYLFAIKPKMQFKRLENKFIILIESKNEINEKNTIPEDDVTQIYLLLDWLNFAGCRIPVAIYTKLQIDKNLRMSMKNNYISCKFINDPYELDTYLSMRKNNSSPRNFPLRGIGLNILPNFDNNDDERSEINNEIIIKNKYSTNNTMPKNTDSILLTGNSSENTSEN